MQRDQPIDKHLVLFVFLTFLISWSIWLPQALGKLGFVSASISPESPLMLLAVWSPTIAATIVTFLQHKTNGVKTLWRAVKLWKVPFFFYLLASTFPLAWWAIAFGIDKALGLQYELKQVVDIAPQFLPILILFSLPNALGEELGWRGFMLPSLQKNHTDSIASATIGIVWGVWHLPTWIAQGLQGVEMIYVFFGIIAVSFLFTWLYNNAKQSVLLTTVFHAAFTLSGYLLPTLPTATYTLVGWIAVGYLIYSKRLK